MNSDLKVRLALVRLNNLYGKGYIYLIDWERQLVVRRIPISQHGFSECRAVKFTVKGQTVRFLGHQLKVNS